MSQFFFSIIKIRKYREQNEPIQNKNRKIMLKFSAKNKKLIKNTNFCWFFSNHNFYKEINLIILIFCIAEEHRNERR